MSLGSRIARLEEMLAAVRFAAGWEDQMQDWAKLDGMSEETMRVLWLRSIGPRPCTCVEQWCALHEELVAEGYEHRT